MGRPDLRPAAGVFEGGAVIDAQVAAQDMQYDLATLAFDGGTLTVTNLDALIGEPVRVRIRARDVSIALEPPRANQHPERAARDGSRRSAPERSGIVDVSIAVGASTLRSRITQRAAEQLALAPGLRGLCADQGGVARPAQRAVCLIIAAHENLRLRRLVRQRQDDADRAADPALRRSAGSRCRSSSTRTTRSTWTSPARTRTGTGTPAAPRCWSARRGAGRSCTSCAARAEPGLRGARRRTSRRATCCWSRASSARSCPSSRSTARRWASRCIHPHDPDIVAIASDARVETRLPQFDLNDAPAIAEFILEHVGLARGS